MGDVVAVPSIAAAGFVASSLLTCVFAIRPLRVAVHLLGSTAR
jgi:hypothetical protein